MWIFVGGPPTNYSLFVGWPPMNYSLFVGGPPTNYSLFVGWPPMNYSLFIGGPPTKNSLYVGGPPTILRQKKFWRHSIRMSQMSHQTLKRFLQVYKIFIVTRTLVYPTKSEPTNTHTQGHKHTHTHTHTHTDPHKWDIHTYTNFA